MSRRSGFTLLELIVVIIIIGILATLGLMQYRVVMEKGRKAEARANLGTLRILQEAHSQEYVAYGDLTTLIGTGLPAGCVADYFFSYACDAGTGGCTATRCTAGGKPPQSPTAYTITLSVLGVWSGTLDWQ